MNAEKLARAYDQGFAHAEEDYAAHGEKRWLDPADWLWDGEEEFDSYWAGYEDYTPGIVVEGVQVEFTQDGAVVTGTVPEIARKIIESRVVKGFSIEY